MFVFGCILGSVIKKEESATGLWELILKPRRAVEEKWSELSSITASGGTRGRPPCIVPSPLTPISGLNYPVRVKVTQSCQTLCEPMDCGPAGSSVHGILQARVLEWVAVPFSRELSKPRDWTQVSTCVADRFFTVWATREVPKLSNKPAIPKSLLYVRCVRYLI